METRTASWFLVYLFSKWVAALIVMESREKKTTYIERALDTGLPLEACNSVDNGAKWANT